MNTADVDKKKVLVFAGTRPEIIKMAPIVAALNQSKTLTPLFCYTGQHRELAGPFLSFFGLKPHGELDLMKPGQSLGSLTSRAAAQMDEFFSKLSQKPAATLVQGDTTTAFVGALTSFYHQIPVGHVEAGLRTASILEPFPEELNRRLITRVARWHYAPTATTAGHLAHESISTADTFTVGNTGIDALLYAVNAAKNPLDARLKEFASLSRPLVLVTAHRRENIGAPLQNIVSAIKRLAQAFSGHDFIIPVHKNPAVEKTIHEGLASIKNVHLLHPLDYPDLVWVMKHCSLILSDSGGIQEEAPTLRKPVLVLRNDTERPEAVEFGTSFLMGSDTDKIFKYASEFLSGKRHLTIDEHAISPYGDGHAATRIVTQLEGALSGALA